MKGCVLGIVIMLVFASGCVKQPPHPDSAVSPPDDVNVALIRSIERGEFSLAIRNYTRLIADHGPRSGFLYNRGCAYLGLKKYEKAHDDFAAALESDPAFWQARYNLALALFELGRDEDGVAELEHCRDLDDGYVPASYGLGVHYLKRKQFDRAVLEFTRVIERAPLSADARVNRGVAYLETGQPDLAVRDFSRVLERSPDASAVFYDRGIAHEQLEDFEAALSDYTRAVEFNPEFGAAYYNRGLLLERIHQRERACRDLATACEFGFCERYRNMERLGECREMNSASYGAQE